MLELIGAIIFIWFWFGGKNGVFGKEDTSSDIDELFL